MAAYFRSRWRERSWRGSLHEALVISSDPDQHAERIREVKRMGATTVVAMNVSGADPRGAIDVYGKQVLPALRS